MGGKTYKEVKIFSLSMTQFDYKEVRNIQKKMIRMLKNKGKYGGAHTETIHLKNCVPKHLRGEKITLFAIEDLFKREILINKKSTGTDHCSLNPRKVEEIEAIENEIT